VPMVAWCSRRHALRLADYGRLSTSVICALLRFYKMLLANDSHL